MFRRKKLFERLKAFIRQIKGPKMELILYRNFQNKTQTLGEMFVIEGENALFKLAALELPYKHNQLRVSCILPGVYDCVKRGATEKIPYKHFILKDVNGRSGICIHVGNKYTDILGCILVGLSHADIDGDGELDVISSRNALSKLLKTMPDEFKITIKQV